MKKVFVIMCLLILGACGGGTPEGTMDIRKSNLLISSNIDNESRRSAHIVRTLGEDYYSGGTNRDGSTRSCGNQQTCNDVAFENMKYWLIDHINEIGEWGDPNAVRDALIVAGFESQIGNTWEETQQYLQHHTNKIRSQAQEIYAELGLHQDFDITKSDFSLFDSMGDTASPSKLLFEVDGNNKITRVIMQENQGTAAGLEFPGKRKGNTSRFTIHGMAHIYRLEQVAPQYQYVADPRWNFLEIVTTDKLTLNQLKEKLIQHADEELAKDYNGFFGLFYPTPPQEVYDAAIAQINAINSWDDVFYAPHPKHMDMDLQSFGKYVGLAYSDFGKMMIPHPSTPDAHMVYHGGNPDNLVSDEHMNELAHDSETNMTFYGRAVGEVTSKIVRNDLTNKELNAIMIAGDATLNFTGTNNGRLETLQMEFPDWYDVTVTRDQDGENINFTNYTNNDERYKFHVVNTDGRETNAIYHNNSDVIGQSAFQLNYYAHDSNSNPSEASGYLAVGEQEPTPEGDTRFLEFQSTFGLIREY